MSRLSWLYIYAILCLAAILALLTLLSPDVSPERWSTFGLLTLLATVAQLYKAVAPPNDHQSYSAMMIFLFAGVLLLSPLEFVLLVILAHTVEWCADKLMRTGNLPVWYIQPFNVATHTIAGLVTFGTLAALHASVSITSLSGMAAIAAALAVYLLINHVLIGQALVLARKVTWKQTGVMAPDNLLTDLCLLCIGYIAAVLWALNPWLVAPALAPLVLVQRALQMPKLREQAVSDGKTGLFNAAHFGRLFAQEMERARRFDRPLAVIMADLDLLRNVNNTFGHLAGDVVLAGVGQIIRKAVRDYDVAARFGGEEFVIVLPETSPEQARLIAERLRKAVEDTSYTIRTSATPIRVTLSLGVAGCPGDATEANLLIHEADLSVYQAKLRGRNCVVAASELPHSLRLEGLPAPDRLEAVPAYEYAARPESVSGQRAPAGEVEPTPLKAPVIPAPARRHEGLLNMLIVGTALAGAVLAGLGMSTPRVFDWPTLAWLVALAALAEFFQIDLYGTGTVSGSLAVNFAAALVTGLEGVIFTSGAIALSSAVTAARNLKRSPDPRKIMFNWATHIIAASAPVVLLGTGWQVHDLGNVAAMALPWLGAALLYYAIENGLIACAIALDTQTSFRTVWHERFRWLVGYHMVLSALGAILAFATTALGALGVVVFTAPVLMMRFAQEQYVERTKDSLHQVHYMNEQLTHANRAILAASQSIQLLNDDLFVTLAKLVDARDPYTSGHSAHVAEYATAIAREMGLPQERVHLVRQASFLHDIGKMAIPEALLQKPTRLTPEEYEYLKSHARIGGDLLEGSRNLRHLAPYVRFHHERWDGGGYPSGLRGEAIPIEARIIAIADAVEAMASDRPYHKAMSLDAIVADLARCAGSQFDPAIAETFARIIRREGARLVVNSAAVVAHQHAAYLRSASKPALA